MGGTRKPAGTSGTAGRRRAAAQRWAARLALLVAAGAIALLLATAGVRSLALLAVGLAGLVATAAALWWALSRRGPARVLAAALAALLPISVLLAYAAVGLLWAVLSAAALWTAALLIGGSLSPRPPGGPAPGNTRPDRREQRSSS